MYLIYGRLSPQMLFLAYSKISLHSKYLNLTNSSGILTPSNFKQSRIYSSNSKYFHRTFCEAVLRKCWKCSKQIDKQSIFFCPDCGSLQDVDSKADYFRILSLDKQFAIDISKLTTAFRMLQTQIHPDKFSNKNDREQKNSLDWSSLINKAYKTLSIPVDRGQYLLQSKGLNMPIDNSSLDKKFLMDMMERNEAVEEADAKAELLELLEQAQQDIKQEIVRLQKCFENDELENAISILVKLKYLTSLENSLKQKMERIDENS